MVVNVEAQDLGLGSGGFDIVCVNLTRGLGGRWGAGRARHEAQLHADPARRRAGRGGARATRPRSSGLPVAVLALHGQLAAGGVRASRGAPEARDRVRADRRRRAAGCALRRRRRAAGREDLIADHVTVAPCFGGEREAITLEGALHAGARAPGLGRGLVGPGPGHPRLGLRARHGGLEALHSAHAALALGCPVILGAAAVERRSARAPPRPQPPHARRCSSCCCGRSRSPLAAAAIASRARARARRGAAGGGHIGSSRSMSRISSERTVESGLPASTMGRTFEEDEDFFRAALAAGAVLARRMEATRR